MVARLPLDPVVIIANMARAVPEDGLTAAQEVALDTLIYLEEHSEDLGSAPGPTAHLVILDLAGALIAFGASNIEELIFWLRAEAPSRAKELAIAVSKASITDAPPSMTLKTPEPATWH
jgi:hypothetical protein